MARFPTIPMLIINRCGEHCPQWANMGIRNIEENKTIVIQMGGG
jgi:hypothetical protein